MSHLLVKKVLTAFILLIPFCFYAIDPAFLWSTHHVMYLPPAIAFGVLGLCLLIIWNRSLATSLGKLSSFNKIGFLLAAGFLMMLLFPTLSDAYGDSRSIRNAFIDYSNDESTGSLLAKIFSPNVFYLHIGERLSFSILKLIMNAGVKYEMAIRGIAIFWGVSTLLAWLMFLKRHLPKLVFPGFLLLVSSYAFQNFHGHAEIYSASIFFVSLTVILLIHAQKHNNWKNKLFTVIALFFAIKSHVMNWVLILGVIHLFLTDWKRLPAQLKNILSIPVQLKFLVPVGLLLMLAVYFFVLDIDQTSYTESTDDLRIVFLPIFSVAEPYDNYALLNEWHLLDFLNVLLGFGFMTLAIMVFANFKGALKEKLQPFEDIGVLILPLAAYMMVLFFFNPIIGLPRDWDLYSQITPLVLMVALLLLNKYKPTIQSTMIVGIIASSLLFISRPVVEASSNFQYKRLLHVGAHLHKTYKAGAVVFLVQGLDMMKSWDDDLISDFSEKMEPHATVGNDIMYGHFLTQIGVRLNEKQRYSDAAYYLEKSLVYSPGYEMGLRNAGIAFMNIGRYHEGLTCAEELLKQGKKLSYYQIAINCAYELQDIPKILEHCNGLLTLDPQNKTAREILRQFE